MSSRRELAGAAVEGDPTLQQAVHLVGDVEGDRDVLLDDHGRRAPGRDRRQCSIDVADDNRGETERHLVEEDQQRVAHQRPADRHGLLLSAGQRRRLPPEQALEQWEDLQHGGDRPTPGSLAMGADAQVLLDGQAGEQAAPFWDEGDAGGHPIVGRHAARDRARRSAPIRRTPSPDPSRRAAASTCRRHWRR